MRWSSYVILMTCFTLMLYLGGYSNIAGSNHFNSWLNNMAGDPGASSANIYSGNYNGTPTAITLDNLTSGQTISNGTTTNDTGIFGIFHIGAGKSSDGNVWNIVAAIGAVGGAALILGALGFSANFIIPLCMLLAMIFMNLFFFPMSFLFDGGMPAIIKVFIPVILNLLFILAVMDFMRGGA